MDATATALIVRLKQTIPVVQMRAASDAGDALEVVIGRHDLKACYDLLSEVLGAPIKEFGKPAKFDPAMQTVVDQLGGIWLDQCLFLKQDAGSAMTYAALWPWASDATRVTLKVGVHPAT